MKSLLLISLFALTSFAQTQKIGFYGWVDKNLIATINNTEAKYETYDEFSFDSHASDDDSSNEAYNDFIDALEKVKESEPNKYSIVKETVKIVKRLRYQDMVTTTYEFKYKKILELVSQIDKISSHAGIPTRVIYLGAGIDYKEGKTSLLLGNDTEDVTDEHYYYSTDDETVEGDDSDKISNSKEIEIANNIEEEILNHFIKGLTRIKMSMIIDNSIYDADEIINTSTLKPQSAYDSLIVTPNNSIIKN